MSHGFYSKEYIVNNKVKECIMSKYSKKSMWKNYGKAWFDKTYISI